MWKMFKKKKRPIKDDHVKEAFVRLQYKIPRIGTIILKIGDKYFRCRELG